MPLALLMLLQAAAATPAPPPPARGERIDILARPCANASNDGGDVVVCGRPDEIAPRLPLARYRGVPDHAVPSNPDLRASVALDGPGIGTECGAYGEGCPIAGGASSYVTPLTVARAAVGGVKSALATRKYKNKGTSIPIDEPSPAAPGSMAGRITP